MASDEPVDIAGEVLAESERAYKFDDGKFVVWLPKSQCNWDAGCDSDVHGNAQYGTMTMPYWLALKSGLI